MKSSLSQLRPVGLALVTALAGLLFIGCAGGAQSGELTDAQIENIVRRSYQYVAMYNVNNKFARAQGGWNTLVADTRLKDHTMRDIARPYNDPFYISGLLDLCHDAVILEIPAFDSKYVSLMITGYDHDGAPVEGIDRLFEATGDFVSAVFRVMPHANEPDRLARIREQAQQVKLVTLSEYRGGSWSMRGTGAHDVANLFVVDGSSFTTGAGVNPTSTIGALALRAADGIWRRRSEWSQLGLDEGLLLNIIKRPMPKTPVVFETTHRVKFSDLDPYNHLRTAAYAGYFVDHRMEGLRGRIGWDLSTLAQLPFMVWVKRLEIDFLKPALGDQEIAITSFVREFRGSDADIECTMVASGKELSRCRMIVTCVDRATQRAITWPAEAVALFYQEPAV